MFSDLRQYIKECWDAGLTLFRQLNPVVGIPSALLVVLLTALSVPPVQVGAAGVSVLAIWTFVFCAPYRIWKRNAGRRTFMVSVPGDEASHFPSMPGGKISHVNLRLCVTNTSDAPLKNVTAQMVDIRPLEPSIEKPLIGHYLYLRHAMGAATRCDVPIGARVEFGVCRSYPDSPHLRLSLQKLPTTFDGRFVDNIRYEITILVACETSASEVKVQVAVTDGTWDQPEFSLVSAETVSAGGTSRLAA